MITTRRIVVLAAAVSVIGLMFAWLWIQAGLPAPGQISPWNPEITLYPSIYAVWLPALYLFFSGVWLYLLWKFPDNPRLRAYWRYDCLSYLAVLLVFTGQIAWPALGAPHIWVRGALLLLLCVKSAGMFRMLYQEAYLLRPTMVGVIGAGIHLLLLPFQYQAFEFPLGALLQQHELLNLAILVVKIIGLNVMTVEMFRLASLFARSPQSAMLSWFAVTFTFPVLGYPKISHILASLFLIFLLRLIFSRLDTRELMLGLLRGANIMILLKLAAVLTLLAAASFIFWSNVKPGLGLHGSRALHAAVLALFDFQGGLFCYTPLYWLALFGMVYAVFFQVWDGVLLLLTGGLAYSGYHLLAYGILDRVIDPTVTVPFLPILGVFMAIAHARFGKMRIFRFLLRLATLLTVSLTFMLVLLFPEFHQIQVKFAAIQRALLRSSGVNLADVLPSTAFQPMSVNTLAWVGAGLLLACGLCVARTKHGYGMLSRTRRQSAARSEATFAPFVVLACVLIGAGGASARRTHSEVPLPAPLVLSRRESEHTVLLDAPQPARRLRIVGSLSAGATVPHDARLVKITVFGSNQSFETLTLRAGRDLADAFFEHPDIRPVIAHGRAALHRSWLLTADTATAFAAHDYYTELTLPRRLMVQKIVIKFADPETAEPLASPTVTLTALTLID
jgi:hypothetical protein